MTTPVDEEMPTIDRISPDDLLEVPPVFSGDLAGFSSDLPETQEYHVFQRLKLFGESFDALDPYWAEIMTAQEFIAASDYYGVEREVAHALRTGRTSYARVIKDGLIARMGMYLRNYEPVDVEGTNTDKRSLDTAEPIIVGELHCPHIKGVTATFENKLEQSEKLGIEVTAAGFGGGGGTRERLYTSTASFTIEAPHCKLICAHLRGHYVIWEHLDTKERMVLTNVTGIHGLFLESLTGAPGYEDSHLCEDEDNYARCYKELNSGVSTTKELMELIPLKRTPGARDPSPRTDEWSTAREYTGNWGLKLGEKESSPGAGVTYTARFVRTITISLDLLYGFNYIMRYRSPRELPQQWVARRIV